LVPAVVQSKSNLMTQVSNANSEQAASEEWQHVDVPIQTEEEEGK
jgi:hypothetical protein